MIDRSEFEVRVPPLSQQGEDDDRCATTMAERIQVNW